MEFVVKVVIAIDSLKGSLTSMEPGEAAAAGIRRVYGDAKLLVRPLADGGEGTVEALVLGMGGRMQTVTATGPLGTPIECGYGLIGDGTDERRPEGCLAAPAGAPADGRDNSRTDAQTAGRDDDRADMQSAGRLAGRTAVIEMAVAAGLTLIGEEERDPLRTTTYGVGELIRDAILKGCRRFIIGIGGSATNDGGIGMLQALGYGILDEEGRQVPFGARGLSRIASITDDRVLPELSECTFRIACDVTNPLCGDHGCSAVYGPQKGADPELIRAMDRWLARFAALAKQNYPESDAAVPGTGAAGGLGFAFLTFTNAVLEPGIRIVLEETGLEDYIRDADLVVTGEGRLDGQTVMGKAPAGVAELAKRYGKTVIAFSGCVTKEAVLCNGAGIDAFFPILRSVVSLEEAMRPETAAENLAGTAEQVFRLIRAVSKI